MNVKRFFSLAMTSLLMPAIVIAHHNAASHYLPADRSNYDAANDAALDCTPQGDGLQHQISAPPAIKIEHSGDRITITYEYWNAVRTIYLDGRSLPDDLELSRLGYSIGQLDGNALVVTTDRLTPSQISLGGNKFYLSEGAQFIERYQLSDDGERMDILWNVIDPINDILVTE